MTLLGRAAAHLRLYESAQILAPGFFGILAVGRVPPWPVLAHFGATYAAHVLSVYSYNDLCDWESDAANPRKAGDVERSRAWLRAQTILLTAFFAVGAAFLPGAVAGILVASQIVCMIYSDPRIRLKGIPMGGEAAHFVVGFGYFLAGVEIASGRASEHLLGGLLFGLLYVTGGSFNEVMDWESDRRASLRHIAVIAGRVRVLRAIFAIHAACFMLFLLYEPGAIMLGLCAGLGLEYFRRARNLAARIDDPAALQGFRRAYRLIFAGLLIVLSALRAADVAGGGASPDPSRRGDPSASIPGRP